MEVLQNRGKRWCPINLNMLSLLAFREGHDQIRALKFLPHRKLKGQVLFRLDG